MKTLFNTTSERIKKELPSIRWIDFDFAQLEQYEHPPVQFPCALISISYPDSQEAGKADRINAEISIKLGFNVRSQTNAAAPVQMRTQAQQYLDIFECCLKKFRRYKPEAHTAFRFVNAIPNMLPNGIRCITLTFTTRFTENGE